MLIRAIVNYFVEILQLEKKTKRAKPMKSAVIREVFAAQPNATVKEVQSALDKRGVKASVALINKIKYGRKQPGAKKSNGTNGKHGSKADAIRGMFARLGQRARARDVVAALAERGVPVSPAQVSMLRKTLSNSGPLPSGGAAVSIEHLRAAKQFSDRLGGIEIAREALASLAQLIEA